MKVLSVCLFIICSFSLIAQNVVMDSNEFLNFLRKEKKIKVIKEDKLKFDDLNFQYPPDSLKYSQIDALYQSAICYWIKASPINCDSLRKQIEKIDSKWKGETIEVIKVISEKNPEIKYHRLSDPIFYKNLVIIKVLSHNEQGTTSGIEIYERKENSWSIIKTLDLWKN